MQVTNLTVEELKNLIRDTVTETIESLLTPSDGADPDDGLQLRPEVINQLRDALERKSSGERGTPAFAVASKLGLNWDEL